jgi:hypothetical protein
MTPKEKAKELVDKFSDVENLGHFSDNGLSYWSTSVLEKQSKQCALIAVNEILNIGCIEVPYWLQVKAEIQAL